MPQSPQLCPPLRLELWPTSPATRVSFGLCHRCRNLRASASSDSVGCPRSLQAAARGGSARSFGAYRRASHPSHSCELQLRHRCCNLHVSTSSDFAGRRRSLQQGREKRERGGRRVLKVGSTPFFKKKLLTGLSRRTKTTLD